MEDGRFTYLLSLEVPGMPEGNEVQLGDPMLALLVGTINEVNGFDISATLVVGGARIKGQLMAIGKWLDAVADSLKGANEIGVDVESTGVIGDALAALPEIVKKSVVEDPPSDVVRFVHLRTPSPVMFYRFRIEEVSGWCFGFTDR